MDTVQAAARPTRLELSGVILFDLVALTLVGVGNVLLAARLNVAPLAIVLFGSALVLRAAQYRLRLLSVPFALPWLLFLLSAWVGVTVSYDPTFSLRKFELILGGIALYYVVATIQSRVAKQLVAWGLVLIGVGAALYFFNANGFHP